MIGSKNLKHLMNLKIVKDEEAKPVSSDTNSENENSGDVIKATRRDFQISRRLFHMSTGTIVATTYMLMLTHQQIVNFLGICACLLYVFDQIRVAYPKQAKKFDAFSKYMLRAEEQLKESAAVPYAMAILLCILSFPKAIALASIYTLAFADPLSALVGIRFGKHRIVKAKSIEGSTAFFIAAFLSTSLVFISQGVVGWKTWTVAAVVSLITTAFEMLPLKLDDNLTIPLFHAFILWIMVAVFGVAL